MYILRCCLLIALTTLTAPTQMRRTDHVSRNKLRPNENERPIIGILAQEAEIAFGPKFKGRSFIAASYIKFVESSGARAVPVFINKGRDYVIKTFKSVNAVLFPGGSVDLKTSGYFRTGKLIYELALDANKNGDYFPLWGTCLGFEMLAVVGAGDNILASCKAEGISSTLSFSAEYKTSKLYSRLPSDLLVALSTENITTNFHEECLTPTNFSRSETLYSMFDILTVSTDKKGLTYISTFEGKHYPFYGTQWHPEIAMFEWKPKGVNHSANAILAAQFVANFFVDESRKNSHKFVSKAKEEKSLIYNYVPEHDRDVITFYEQAYIF